jgi:hypothetical protein
MAPERLSRLQHRILAWLVAEERRTRGTMAADHLRPQTMAGWHRGQPSAGVAASCA